MSLRSGTHMDLLALFGQDKPVFLALRWEWAFSDDILVLGKNKVFLLLTFASTEIPCH